MNMKLKCSVINQSLDNFMNCKLSSCFSSMATLFCLSQACKILSLAKYYPPFVLAGKIKRISFFVIGNICQVDFNNIKYWIM